MDDYNKIRSTVWLRIRALQAGSIKIQRGCHARAECAYGCINQKQKLELYIHAQ